MRSPVGVLATLVALALPGMAGAQTAPPPPTMAPLNIVVPNYNGVAVGEIGSLEANAYVARSNDASSTFYNPAGLLLAGNASVSGSAGVFQFAEVAPENLDGKGGSLQQIPSLVGLVVPKLLGSERWAWGLSVSRSYAWSASSDFERTFELGTSVDHVQLSSAAQLSGLQGSFGIGYEQSARLRLGGTVDLQATDFARSQSRADQYATDTGLSALLIEASSGARLWHLRMAAGVQYDITPELRLGAVVRSPGLSLKRSGSYTHEGQASLGRSTSTATFFDTDADVEYRLPLEFKAGLAWVGKRAQVEVDLASYAAGGQYAAMHTDQTWTLLSDAGQEGPPSVQKPALEVPFIDSVAVANVAVGGQVRLTPSGSWTVHGGYATDRSPVGADDTLFTRVNMQSVTAGISGRTKFVLGSVGIRYETGTTDTIVIRQMQNGQPLSTRLKISHLGVVYSAALLF
jgi:hypothetical protein